MGIDWLTVGAQAVNFLVLVYLLQHFLYTPVINAMDRREQRIANRIEEAREREAEAQREARKYREQRQALEEERQQRLEAAEAEAEQRRQQLLEEAREEVRQSRQQWEIDLAREQEELKGHLRHSAAQAVERITRKILTDLADADLEARMVNRFLEKLEEADRETREAFSGAASLVVRTAFAPSHSLEKRLREGLVERLGEGHQLEFQQSGDLLCGIELAGAGHKLAWSFEQYLREIEDALEQVLGQRAGSKTPPVSA